MFAELIARAGEVRLPFGPLRVDLLADMERTRLVIDGTGARLGQACAERADFTLAATAAAWRELGTPEARPGFQTLSAMRRTRALVVTGDMVAFNRHLLLLERLFARLDEPEPDAAEPVSPLIEPITGRYLRLAIAGRACRVYFEEAGEGIPLVCLHTAGSDSRQYRALLNDPEITCRFRVVAFDLPWHGKSSPPAGFQRETYRLTTDGYVETIIAVIDALGLDRPVVMGCSIGGRVVIHLAMRHPDRLRAVIGLQSALHAEDRSIGDPAPEMVLHRPDIHCSETAGALMAGMIAPRSPAPERWETMWHYMQGGPGVFHGDLHYYFEDGDLRNAPVDGLRGSPCPVYLLSGEHDVSATPQMGRELAERIGAAHFEVMRDVGHFPMSENPGVFRDYLLPVLGQIAGNSR